MTAKAWGLVWSGLYEVYPSDPNLMRRGKKWIKSIDAETYSVYHVWEPISSVKPIQPALIAAMIRWLETAYIERRSWSKIWLNLCQIPLDNSFRATLRNLGINFLAQNATAPQDVRNSIAQSLQKLEG